MRNKNEADKNPYASWTKIYITTSYVNNSAGFKVDDKKSKIKY